MSRFDSLKDNFLKNKILVENFTFLSALQIVNLVLFLITVPYLFRILGSQNYGLIIFAQTIAFYFSIFVNFGFNLTATRDISINREDNFKISEIVSSVLTIKTVLFLISLILMWFLTILVKPLRNNQLLLFLSMAACLSEALFPVWYFQGLEKMKYLTIINVVTRILATILILIVIDSREDYVIYPAILAIGTLMGAVAALAIVFRLHRIEFRILSIMVLYGYFRENILYFFSNISTQIYLNANKIIIGSFLGMVTLAYYDLADKIINIIKVPYSLIGQTLFPKVARDKDFSFLSRIMVFTFIFTVVIVIGIFFFSNPIIKFFSGVGNVNSMNILKILSLTLIPISIGMFYGDILLINYGLKMEYAKMRFFGLFLYLTIFFILYIFDRISVIPIAMNIVIVEVFLAVYSYLLCKRAGISR